MEEMLKVKEVDFHPILKDVENIFWFFMLSTRTLSDLDIQNMLRQKNLQEGYLPFNEMLDKVNESIELRIEINNNIVTSKANIQKNAVFVGKAIAMLVYDYVLNSKYQSEIIRTDIWKFLKFIRNAAVHGNVFNMIDEEGIWKLEINEKIIWNNKEISRALHKKSAFNDFISIFEIFILARDLSNKLKKIDKE